LATYRYKPLFLNNFFDSTTCREDQAGRQSPTAGLHSAE
jgi:hypothetical protein